MATNTHRVSKTHRESGEDPLKARDQPACAGAGILEDRGLDRATMEDVAARAGVAGATLYSHFPGKDAVVARWLQSQHEAVMPTLVREAMSRQSFMASAATLLDGSASWWEEHRALAAPYVRWRFQQVREDGDQQPTSEFVPVYERLVRQAQESGELSGARDPCELAAYLHSLSLGALIAWVTSEEISLSQRYANALEFFMEGVRVRKGVAILETEDSRPSTERSFRATPDSRT